MSCLRYAPRRSICPEVREASWHPHRSRQVSCQVFWNGDDQVAGIVAGSPISQPLSRAQNTVPSLTPSKRPKPMKMNDMAIATRQLQQS